MKLIYAQEKINVKDFSIFLAGPTPRKIEIASWRPEAIKLISQSSFKGTVLLPEFKSKDGFTNNFAYDKQIIWELEAMKKVDKIVFWIDRKLPDMPAFTTNTEFGYWVAKNPSKIILGIPEGSEKCDYIKYLAKINNIKIYTTFEEITELLSKVSNKKGKKCYQIEKRKNVDVYIRNNNFNRYC